MLIGGVRVLLRVKETAFANPGFEKSDSCSKIIDDHLDALLVVALGGKVGESLLLHKHTFQL